MHQILSILDEVNLPSRDDQTRFVDTTRLDGIAKCLGDGGSPWALRFSGPLFRIYGRSGVQPVPDPVVISSHADSNYGVHQHGQVEGTQELLGTFDNSITNAVLVGLMLEDRLPPGCLVAFTGDEENDSEGAAGVMACLRGEGMEPRAVIVLDITDDRHYGHPCTLENYFAKHRGALPATEEGFLECLQAALEARIPHVHHDDAWPDESWRYEEEDVPVFSLCVPTRPARPGHPGDGWMHLDEGVRVRADLIPEYGNSLARLCQHLLQSR
jgi:hypothetical protein